MPIAYFSELVRTGLNWFLGSLGRVTSTVPISAQTSQKGIKCTKAKEKLRSYCQIYILCTRGRGRDTRRKNARKVVFRYYLRFSTQKLVAWLYQEVY